MSKNTSKSMVVAKNNHPSAPHQEPLTPEQEDRFIALEEDISNNISSGFKLAAALAEIRSGKLYRHHGFDNFEEYCKMRWDYSRSYCLRLADTHTVLTDLKEYENNGAYPRNEAQARVFVPLKKDQRLKLLKTVYEESEEDITTASELAKYRRKLFPEQFASEPGKVKSKGTVIDVETVTETKPAIPSILEAVEAAVKALKSLDQKKTKDTAWAEPLRKFIKCAAPVVEWEKRKVK